MRSRRLLGLLATLLMVACGGPGASTPQLGALKNTVQVTFWHALSGNLSAELTKLTDQFNSSQSTVHVNLVAKGAYTDLNKAILTGLAANQPPDLAQCIETDAAKYNSSKALADLTPYINAADGLSGSDLKDIFPVMLNAAKLADSSKGVTGAEGPSIDTFLSMLYEYGGHLYDNDSNPGKTTVNSDAGVKAMTLWYNAIKAGSVKPIPAGNFADQTDFQNQKTAMYISTQVSYQFIVKPIGTKFKFAETAFPAGDKGTKDEMFGANLCAFNKSAKDVQHGAFLYIKYLTSVDSTSAWAQTTSYMPVRQSAYKTLSDSFYTQNPNQGVGPSMLSKGGLIVLPATPTSNEQRDALSTEIGNIAALRKDPKTGLSDAATKMNDILATG